MSKVFPKIITILFLTILFADCTTKTAEEYYRIGLSSDSLGFHKKSFKYITKAIKKDSKNADYYLARANVRLHGHIKYSFKNMVKDYNSALGLKPWYPPVLYSRAYYEYFRLFDYRHAQQDLDTLLKKAPRHVEGYLLRGEMYYEKKDTITGNYNFRKALEFTSDKQQTLTKIASVQTNKGYFRNALVNWNRSLNQSDKVKFCCYASMSYCYWKINKRDSACYYYELMSDKTNMLGDFKDIQYFCERK